MDKCNDIHTRCPLATIVTTLEWNCGTSGRTCEHHTCRRQRTRKFIVACACSFSCSTNCSPTCIVGTLTLDDFAVACACLCCRSISLILVGLPQVENNRFGCIIFFYVPENASNTSFADAMRVWKHSTHEDPNKNYKCITLLSDS